VLSDQLDLRLSASRTDTPRHVVQGAVTDRLTNLVCRSFGMHGEYDLFEELPNGAVIWPAMIIGRDKAVADLTELIRRTSNECYALHTSTHTIIRMRPPYA